MARPSSTKFYAANDNTINAGAQAETTILQTVGGTFATGDLGQKAVNVHGVRLQIRITDDEITLANTENHGYWAIVVQQNQQAAPTLSTSQIDTNEDNSFIWAIGKWSCQRNSMGIVDVELKTSRNIPSQFILRVVVANSAVSDSTVRQGLIFSCWLKEL